MSGRKPHKPTLFWAVEIGDHLIPHLALTRREARSTLSTRGRLEKLRPELCPETGRARVVRVELDWMRIELKRLAHEVERNDRVRNAMREFLKENGR